MRERQVERPPYGLIFFVIGFFIALLLIQPYLLAETINELISSSDSIVISAPIIRRKSKRNIGILIVIDETVDLNDYKTALGSIQCYAQLHHYHFELIKINNYWKSQCNNQKLFFLRHCIASRIFVKHDWTLLIEIDTGIVNPHRLIEDFIDDHSNVVFYDAFMYNQIETGSYLFKNSNASRKFLSKMAAMEHQIPSDFSGFQNGAIFNLFIQEFYANFSTSHISPSNCQTIWSKSKTFQDLHVFEACCRMILGEQRHFCQSLHCVTVLPKDNSWLRDSWITSSKWSIENDFMLRGWKESTRIPKVNESNPWTRASLRLLDTSWYSPLAIENFDNQDCQAGTQRWKWWRSSLVPPNELTLMLDQKRQQTLDNLLTAVSKISNY